MSNEDGGELIHQRSVLVTYFPMQHFLYFLPLPQGQGALRLILG
jgi:hypothetical protein